MTITTAVLLFLSWVASTFIGIGAGITYAIWSDRQILRSLSEAIVRIEMGDDR
jgi:ABC-type phosphate transport system permease subunit